MEKSHTHVMPVHTFSIQSLCGTSHSKLLRAIEWLLFALFSFFTYCIPNRLRVAVAAVIVVRTVPSNIIEMLVYANATWHECKYLPDA